MSKQREFWILGKNFDDGVALRLKKPDPDLIDNYTHVREVIPIDWEKFWDVLRKRQYPNAEYQFLRELIEKAIKGEL